MSTIVKNKKKLCETSLSDFSIEQIEGVPFYSRYREIGSLLRKHIPSLDFNRYFAEPCENRTKRIIEWFFLPGEESPSSMSDLKNYNPDTYSEASSQRDSILNEISSAIQKSGENERKYLNALLTGINSKESDKTTYYYDNHILFGIWGMRAKAGRNLENVIREDVLDHRVFTITFNVEGEAQLTPSSIRRKFGYRLTPTDVPQVLPADGWVFTQWRPNVPQGFIISEDTTFTAFCEKATLPPEEEKEKPENGETGSGVFEEAESDVGKGEEDKPYKFRVSFRSEDGGSLNGKTEYIKSAGEKVLSGEVPTVIPDEGYEFVGWDRQPEGYEVYSDTDFLARFRKVKHGLLGFTRFGRNGCLHALLNWLLLGLGLLLLFLLLWCFVFGKCHFNLCGCDCNDPVPNNVLPTPQNDVSPMPDNNPTPHTGDVQILLSWSNLNDLDIACIDPQGNTVWYKNKTVPSGGVLDIDMNANNGVTRSDPIENIYWPAGSAPQGQYSVILTYYAKNDNADMETPYTVKVKHGETIDTYTGILTNVKQQVNICTFIIE